MNKSKSIYISILNQGWVRPELVSMIHNLPNQRKYNVFIAYPAQKPITHNRNTIVKRFLETGMDYLLMIDNDNVPPPNVLDLADYGKDVIGGLCYAFMHDTLIPLALKKNKKNLYDLMDIAENEGLIECDGIGSGVMMIKREVLQDVAFPFENYYDPEGIKTRGLDISFCEKAKAKGFEVWCHTDMKCSHWTTIDLKQVFHGYSVLRAEIKRVERELKKCKKQLPSQDILLSSTLDTSNISEKPVSTEK